MVLGIQSTLAVTFITITKLKKKLSSLTVLIYLIFSIANLIFKFRTLVELTSKHVCHMKLKLFFEISLHAKIIYQLN